MNVNLVGVDAPVVDVEGPGARHSPVVDVLHRVEDFHLRKILIISECRTVTIWTNLYSILDNNKDDSDTYSQAILGGWDGVEFSIVVEPSHGTHLEKHMKKKHENL